MRLNKRSLLLYAVTDRLWLKGRTLASVVEESLKGGVTMLQLREKLLDRDGIKKEALELSVLCKKYNVPFIINDDAELASETGADGLHVGQEDMEASWARKLLGSGKILGVSAHTVEEAVEAEKAGADYLGIGAAFPTGTKDDTGVLKPETIKAICAAVSIPCVAIGGIKAENIMKLSGNGLAGVSVVSAIYAQDDIQNAARQLRKLSERMVDS